MNGPAAAADRGAERHPDSADESEAKEFEGKKWATWHDVPRELVEYHQGVLAFFSPEAFRFFLPAFMTYALSDLDGILALFTAFAVLPPSAYRGAVAAPSARGAGGNLSSPQRTHHREHREKAKRKGGNRGTCLSFIFPLCSLCSLW